MSFPVFCSAQETDSHEHLPECRSLQHLDHDSEGFLLGGEDAERQASARQCSVSCS